ncbi:MAG: hypothetical protein ABIP94_06170 [Planctomycetota bacterium]
MQPKNEAARRTPRPLTEDELNRLGAEIWKISGEFDVAAATVRAGTANSLILAHVRDSMARAGRHLLVLIRHGVIERPTQPAPWLSWSLPSGSPRPCFREYRGKPQHSTWPPKRGVSALVPVIDAQRLVSDRSPRSTREGNPTVFRHRHVFLEAIGWLGHRCYPRVSVDLPHGEVGLGADGVQAEEFVQIVVDWHGHTPEEANLFFLSVAQAASAVCRLVAEIVARAPCRDAVRTVLEPRSDRSVAQRTPLEVLYAIQDLCLDASHKSAEAGAEVHDRLFGKEQLFTDIRALSARRPEFERMPVSPLPTKLHFFAARSGHEAIAKWCERVAGIARARVADTVRYRIELGHARSLNDEPLVIKLEHKLDHALVHLATVISSVLGDLDADFAWIECALRGEDRRTTSVESRGTGSVNPRPAGDTARARVDESVERAFDLLVHYQSLLRETNPGVDAERRALADIEEVLRQWLPCAETAGNSPIAEVHSVIGDREAAARVLANVDLRSARIECLQGTARAAFPSTLRPYETTAKCRDEIQHWRGLLPMIRRRHDGQRYVDASDQQAALAVGHCWSNNLDSRPSRLGASLILAAACDAVATAARDVKVPTAAIRPAMHLAHRLRESPDWTQVDGPDLVGMIDEQVGFARDVGVLLAEIDLVSVADFSHGEQPASAGTAAPVAKAEWCLSTHPPAETEQAMTPTVPESSYPCFLRNGDGWEVRFGGTGVFVKNVGGMQHLRDLLMRPGTPVPAIELDGLHDGPSDSRQEIAGTIELQAIHSRLGELESEIGDAKARGAEGEAEPLHREREALRAQVKEATYAGGRRVMKSTESGAVGRVRSAIARALVVIRRVHTPLWEHLDVSLTDKSGAQPCYRPSPPVTWRVNT